MIRSTEVTKATNTVQSHRRQRALAWSRVRSRGAAMVEGTVVFPVLLIFLGLMTFVKMGYDEKFIEQHGTRRDVAYYASHNCEQGSASKSGDSDLGFDAQAANDIAKKKGGDDGTSSSTSTKMYTAHKRVNGSVTHYLLTRKVKGESWMMCNEAKHDGSIGDWISYVKSMVSGMGTNNKPF